MKPSTPHRSLTVSIVVWVALSVALNAQEISFANLKSKALTGDTDAQFGLGSMHESGEVVLQDFKQAMKWYRMAAEGGHVASLNRLGNMYADGRGVTPDKSEAERWFVRAAEIGGPDEQLSLGRMYANGTAIRQSDADAIRWIKSAANMGDANAMAELGKMHETGKAVRQSNIDAHIWYGLAAAAGATNAAQYRDQVARKMTLEELIEAQKRARERKDSIEKSPEWQEYFQSLSLTIKHRWYQLLDESGAARSRTGIVVVKFRLNADGRVSNVKAEKTTVGALQTYYCESAVADTAPYEPWSKKLTKRVGKDFYDVTFVFNHN
jgi:TPR repeat protein